MASDPRPDPRLDRRQALGCLALSALPTQDSQPATREDLAGDMAAAMRLAGIEFQPQERQLAQGRLRELRTDYAALRAAPVGWHLHPSLRFDPLPDGVALPPTDPGPVWTAPAEPPLPANDLDLAFASVETLAGLLRARKLTSRRLTELALARLEAFDPRLLCVVTLLRDQALAAADQADAELAAGRVRSALHGIPYGAKDLFAWPQARTTFGARPYREQVWDTEATVLARPRAAGAVLVAKLTLGALAMGDVWFGGTTKNPWNPAQGSSGSSAGSTAAVAAGLVPFALGTETLGSIVSPCARCGVSGLRPTFGTVSRAGAMPLSWSMDKVGAIARHAQDLALVYDVIRGPDGKDPSVRKAAFAWRRAQPLRGFKIGYLDAARGAAAQEPFLEALRAAGAELVATRLPAAPYRPMLVMLNAEGACAFDELTRSGGLRELDAQGPGDWPNTFRTARTIPAVEYLRAARLRTQLLADMHATMAPLDALIALPGAGASLVCTNLTGHPCVVLPLGFRQDGTPTAITVIGRLYEEAKILAVAEHWQSVTAHHLQRPPLG